MLMEPWKSNVLLLHTVENEVLFPNILGNLGAIVGKMVGRILSVNFEVIGYNEWPSNAHTCTLYSTVYVVSHRKINLKNGCTYDHSQVPSLLLLRKG